MSKKKAVKRPPMLNDEEFLKIVTGGITDDYMWLVASCQICGQGIKPGYDKHNWRAAGVRVQGMTICMGCVQNLSSAGATTFFESPDFTNNHPMKGQLTELKTKGDLEMLKENGPTVSPKDPPQSFFRFLVGLFLSFFKRGK